ncbi:vacuolar protein sorting-associated protein 26C-like [Orcinus orca]|uniref:vacuolar protein sorting-associated protein 26C-like n=1 Tax=Orcinus orca TaxID=9733 RepID=UPI0014427E7D|nr:vacuolar protein sorting-associated protein 26C-like [Orcinus orca]
MGTALDIKVKRANKVYHTREMLSGVVVVSGKDSVQHQGVYLTVEGAVNLQLSAKSVGVFEAFYNSVKPKKGKLTPSPVDFTVTPETLQNVKERALLPKFLIRGHLNSTSCVITHPLMRELVVESSEATIKSIELQLVHVETCGCAEGYARDATEIQNIQIANGDVCRGLSVPIYMVFPQLFTCPTLETTNFKVEFEVNIVVLLHPEHLITENFPLKLCRM